MPVSRAEEERIRAEWAAMRIEREEAKKAAYFARRAAAARIALRGVASPEDLARVLPPSRFGKLET